MDNLTQKESLILGVINFVLIKKFPLHDLDLFPSEVCFLPDRRRVGDYAKAKERSSDEMGCHGVCKYHFLP